MFLRGQNGRNERSKRSFREEPAASKDFIGNSCPMFYRTMWSVRGLRLLTESSSQPRKCWLTPAKQTTFIGGLWMVQRRLTCRIPSVIFI